MIETYHYASFSVQTAIGKEQRDRDVADELIRSTGRAMALRPIASVS